MGIGAKMFDEMKKKIIKNEIQEYEILAMKKISKEDLKMYRYTAVEYDGMITIRYKNIIATELLSSEEQKSSEKEYIPYIRGRLNHICELIQEIENKNNEQEDIERLAGIICSQIYTEGLLVGVDKTEEAWDKFDEIIMQIKEKFSNNKTPVQIYAEVLKESGCTWGLKETDI